MKQWRQHAARGAYSWLLALLKPVYVLRLWWRGRREPLYRHAIAERLGAYRGSPSHGWVWVHAVSLGETRAAAALVDALRRRVPGMKLLLTHGTATGREAGAGLLQPGDRQAWLPYDTPRVVRRFFRQFRPAVGVLMETEVWPNLLLGARASRVPMVLANARLSARSRRRGERFDLVLRPAASSIALVLAQTEDDARRVRESGASDVMVVGNLKFDMTPDPALLARGHAWHAMLGRDVVLAAVFREGEEAMLLDAWLGLPAPRPLLVVVPRHPQRFDEVAALIRDAGLTLARRSSWEDAPSDEALRADAWLGDSMREMPLYYATAQVALLGGSYAPLGGQNLIEAAACGCPVVMGPHTFNFADAARLSLEAGAAVRVTDMADGVRVAIGLLTSDRRASMADAARRFAEQHGGAAERMAERIVGVLDRRG
ncbi:MAG: 3-deoxy-D-manno-octulosonic acid transferase [Proteobacteria bacterium]|nr:3-deoxy-D-manno-octulosonic acid transferase [Pseudomonadota bacterium]